MRLLRVRVLLLLLLVLAIGSALLPTMLIEAAPDLYWIGGSGNWTDTAHWGTFSGGGGPHAAPTTTDKVIFDSLSDSGAGFTVTVNGTANCADMDWSLVDQIPTLAGASALNIYGSVLLKNTMVRSYTGAITFAATSGPKSLSFTTIAFASAITFNGAAGSWQLVDALNDGASTITLTNGSLDTNGQTVTCGTLTSTAGTQSLVLGATHWDVSVAWTATFIDSITPGTSTIHFAGNGTFAGAGLTYYDWLHDTVGTTPTITGSNSFHNFTRLGTAVTTDRIYFTQLTTQTISGTLTCTGNSGTNRLWIGSDAAYQATLNAAVVAITNSSLYYITGGGAGSWNLYGGDVTNALATVQKRGMGDGLSSNISLFVADAYWVGGTGAWFNGGTGVSAHWSNASGGAANDVYFAGYNTNVHFDVNSFSLGSSFVDLQAGGGGTDYRGYCNNMDWTGALFSPTFSATPGTTYAQSHVVIRGNVTFISTLSLYHGNDSSSCYFDLPSISGSTITMNSVLFTGDYGFKFWFSGNWGLADNFTAVSTNGANTITIGDLDSKIPYALNTTLTTNNYNMTCNGAFLIDYNPGYLKTLALGSSTVTCSSWTVNSSIGLTISGTYNIIMNGTSTTFTGGAFTYYDASLIGATQVIAGANTFHNLTRTGTAIKTESWTLNANQTVTNALTITGDSSVNRVLVQSDTIGTARTLTVTGSVSINHAVFLDITAAGALTPWNLAAFDDGPLGNVTNITFPAGHNVYWFNNSNNWSTIGNWSLTSGGPVGGADIPLPQDTARFDGSSITLASRQVTMDMPWYGNITTTGVQYNPELKSTTYAYIYGTLTLGGTSGFTWTTTSGTVLLNRSDVFLTTGGIIIGGAGGLAVSTYGATVALSDALTVAGPLTLLKGTLTTAGKAVTASIFDATGTVTRALDLGASTVTLNGIAAVAKWIVPASGGTFTLANSTSLIYLTNSVDSITQTFTGGGWQNYNDITVGGTGIYTLTVAGSNKFVNFAVERIGGKAKTIKLTASTTTTISGLGIALSGTTRVTLKSDSTTVTAALVCTSGVIYVDYVDIALIVTSGGASFYSGTNSTVNNGYVQNTTGTMTGSPVTLYESINGSAYTNTPTITVAGTFTSYLGNPGLTGTATSGGWVVSGTPKPLVAGSTIFTVNAGGSGTINIVTVGSGWNPSTPTPPAITTLAASGIGSITATGNGNVTGMGAYTVPGIYVFFQTSLTGTYTGEEVNTTEQHVYTASPPNVTQLISSLTVDTLYHYRAAIRYNVVSYVYGSDLTFTTTGKPVVATGSAADITISSATLQGSIVVVGIYPPDYCYFQYNTSGVWTDPYTSTPEQTLSTVTGFDANIVGLTAGQLYRFRAAVRYVNGVSLYEYGTNASFTTTPATNPVVTTQDATQFTTTGARIQATLDALGSYSSVNVYFKVGKTIAYELGETTYQTKTAPAGYYQDLTGLAPNTTYHYIAYVKFGATATGVDKTFATLNPNATQIPGIDAPDVMLILDVKVYTGYLETGDELFVISQKVIYDSGVPAIDPSDYFADQLLDGANFIRAQNPVTQWGFRPTSIYLSAASAIPWKSPASIKLLGIPSKWGVPPTPSTFLLQEADWRGYYRTNDEMRNQIILMADAIGVYDSTQMTQSDAVGNQVLSNLGAVIFTKAIPRLTTQLPELFAASIGLINVPTNTPADKANPYAKSLQQNTQTKLGPQIYQSLQPSATLFNTSVESFLTVLSLLLATIAAVIIGLAAHKLSAGLGTVSVLLIGGIYVGAVTPDVAVPLAIFAVLGLVLAFVRHW